jgi:excisionase family DNA binding protein
MERLWGVNETAEFLGIRVSTLRDWVFRRKIPCIKVGKLVKFEPAEIEQWLETRKRESKR